MRRLRKSANAGADFGMLHAQLHRRLEIAELVAAVVAAALEFVGEHLFVLEQARDAVGQLDLAAGAGGIVRRW